jgi:SAM-dependent methyltransferase
LVKNIKIKNPEVLEIGAGTGLLAQKILEKYNGFAILVDNNLNAYQMFKKFYNRKLKIAYVIGDLFHLSFKKEFDVVISDGLIEHFKDIKKVMLIHEKFTRNGGYVIIVFPHNSLVNKIIWLINPWGEFLSEKKLIDILPSTNLKLIRKIRTFHRVGMLLVKGNENESTID